MHAKIPFLSRAGIAFRLRQDQFGPRRKDHIDITHNDYFERWILQGKAPSKAVSEARSVSMQRDDDGDARWLRRASFGARLVCSRNQVVRPDILGLRAEIGR